MNILICGEYSSLCKQLLRRLEKEKNEIYYLTGSKRDFQIDVPIFQTYRFSYADENLVRAVKSAKADVLIMMGALDLNFMWGFGETTAADYTSSMLRILTAAKNADVKEIIYLSSTEIFETNTDREITRKTEPLCKSLRAKTLKRMEELCLHYADENMQVDIVRLPQVFGEYENNRENNICLATAYDFMRSGKITCFLGQKHSALYKDDAAEIIFRIIKNNAEESLIEDIVESTRAEYSEKSEEKELKKDSSFYNIFQFKGYVFAEKELCDILQKGGWRKDAVVNMDDTGRGVVEKYPLANLSDTQEEELNFKLRYTFEEAINLLCRSLLKYRKEEERQKQKTFPVLPIIETIIFAIIAFILSYVTKDMWIGSNFNFFVVFVVFIAAAYGTAHGLLASLLGAIGTLILMTMDASLVGVLSGFEFFIKLLMLVVVGVIAGFMRDKFFRRNSTLKEENDFLTNELSDINRINDSNVYVKNIYEKRLIEYQNSLARIYELTSQLDVLATQKVTYEAVRVVSEMMNTPNVAIYISSHHSDFFRLAACGTKKAMSCGKSIKLSEDYFLYEAVISHDIYMNRNFSLDKPTFAGAVYDDGVPIVVVMVWSESIENVNLYESNILAVLCRLIENSFIKAIYYEDALREKTYLENTSLLRQDSFKEIVDNAEDGRKQGLLTYMLLKLDLKGKEPVAAEGIVRTTDYLGVIEGNVYICLSNSNENEVGVVLDRIEKRGYSAEVISYIELCSIYEAMNEH